MRLHLGVLDIPHPTGNDVSTGDVAEFLENKYHVMELFYEEVGGEAIARAFEQSAKNAVEDLFSGRPADTISLTDEATQEIETTFRVFIDQRELDHVVPGVPTMASTGGVVEVNGKKRRRGVVNHRMKHPYSQANAIRPSFRDTGTYQASFRAWTDA